MTKITTYLDLAIEYLFYFLIFSVPLVFTTSNYELFEFPKMVLTYALAIIIFGLYLTKVIFEGKITILRSKFLVAVGLFLISQILSTIFSVDIHTSLFGYYSRFNGGLISQITYFILLWILIATFDKTKVLRLIHFIVATALIVALWGIPSHFNLDPSCKLITGAWTSSCWSSNFNPILRIFSTLGQPNWLAAYLGMILPLALVSIIIYKNIFVKIYYSICSILIFWAFILTNSRAATLGLGIALIIFVILTLYNFIKEKNWQGFLKSNLLFLILIAISYSLIVYLWGGMLIGRVQEAKQSLAPQTQNQTNNQPSSQAQAEGSQANQLPSLGGTESGKIRFIVWQGAVEIFKKYPIIGSGVETFAYTYYNFRPTSHNLTTEWDFLYNKAHNEYLNYLSTTGAIGLGTYLLLIFSYLLITTRYLLKKSNMLQVTSDKLFAVGLLSGYIAYLIQNFFSFSIVAIATLFFIFPGLTLVIIQSSSDPKNYWYFNLLKITRSSFVKYPLMVIICLGAFYLLISTYRYFLADQLFVQAESYSSISQNEQAVVTYQKAIRTSPIDEPLYLVNLGLAASDLAVQQQENLNPQLVELAKESVNRALKKSPANLNLWRTATKTYLTLAQIDPSYLTDAKSAAQTAASLAPTEPEIQYQLGVTQRTLGENDKARLTFKKVLKLKPDFTKAKEALEEIVNGQ